MGRNQGKRSIRNEQKHQGHEDGYHDRQARNVRQYKSRFIFIDGAGPDDPGVGGGQAMVTPVAIYPGMEIKRP